MSTVVAWNIAPELIRCVWVSAPCRALFGCRVVRFCECARVRASLTVLLGGSVRNLTSGPLSCFGFICFRCILTHCAYLNFCVFTSWCCCRAVNRVSERILDWRRGVGLIACGLLLNMVLIWNGLVALWTYAFASPGQLKF
jgi:hypothetical protein